jgi:hypothetical protein
MASSSHLKQNEKGRITVKIDTAQKKGMLIKTVDILSNDPHTPKATLTLKADVKEAVASGLPH